MIVSLPLRAFRTLIMPSVVIIEFKMASMCDGVHLPFCLIRRQSFITNGFIQTNKNPSIS